MLSPVENCIGCTACLSVCSNSALFMGKNAEGFYVAIKGDSCVRCGKCTEFCLRKEDIKKRLNRRACPYTYAAWAKDKTYRSIGNSGGLFSAISNYWIETGGAVVAPIYNERFVPQYIITTATNREKIRLQAWSKFVQSELGNIFFDIKRLLSSGTRVLFIGAPCQVKGLYAFLGGDNDNLVTVQFPCIGMPVQWFYQEYLKDLSKSDLSDILAAYGEIADKDADKRVMKIVLKNGNCIYERAQDSIYVKAWNSFKIVNEACCSCKDNVAPVCADFSWGNFWYLGTIKKFLNSEGNNTNGISMLLVHSNKARNLLNQWQGIVTLYSRSYKEACIGHLMFQSQLDHHIIYRRYIRSKSKAHFKKEWKTIPYHQLKKCFFSAGSNKTFSLAAKLGIKFKAYVWAGVYYNQVLINKFYELFQK